MIYTRSLKTKQVHNALQSGWSNKCLHGFSKQQT